MVDWREVAETLTIHSGPTARANMLPTRAAHFDAAIRLCELAAKLPAGEAERVLEAAGCHHLSIHHTDDGITVRTVCDTCGAYL